jgi:outer membrane protein
MEFFCERREALRPKENLFHKLRATAAISCVLMGTMPSWALGQQQASAPAPQATQTNQTAQGLPPEPAPNYTQPLYLRPTARDYTKPRGYWPNPIAPYSPTTEQPGRFSNTLRLDNLVKDGKIYLSLSDAIILGLENNFDIAIQRYNLNIADTDILRARTGSSLLGVSSGLVTGTVGGTTSTVSASSGGGPGGTTAAAGGAGAGASGLVLTTNGQGPQPEQMDPTLTAGVQLERAYTPTSSVLQNGSTIQNQNSNTYNFTYNQGFVTGTALQVGFNNSRVSTFSLFSNYEPTLQSNFQAKLTQHLLNGCCIGIQDRFVIQAKNDRRIADSAFRQQLLYTINQIENIYWGLVSAYEDVQAKQRALAQSTQLASDNRKQLQIGTLAPLDVVNADSAVANDKQALISSQSTLEYQQLVMKQAIARNLDDPTLANAPVIPTDRVSLLETPEEHTPVEDLVRQADANSPSIEQAMLTLKNDEITLKGVKNGLLPTVDVYGFYGASAIGGASNPDCANFLTGQKCNAKPVDYSTVFSNLFNSTGPDKGVGFNITVPIRNRTAQALQARSMLEYRQAQMRLAQLYVQTRMNIINQQYALTNDRAAVQAALAAREYASQSLDAEQKKYRLGASTTANVLQMERNLATAENNVISSTAKYATDRAALAQTLANTLDRYGVNIVDAANGTIPQQQLSIPGLEPAKQLPEVVVPGQQENLQKQEQQAVPEPQNPPQPKPLLEQPAQPQQPH